MATSHLVTLHKNQKQSDGKEVPGGWKKRGLMELPTKMKKR